MSAVPHQPGQVGGFTLLDGWALLKQYRWLILGMTLLAVLTAVAIAFITTPRFRAEIVVTEVSQGGLGNNGLNGSIRGLASLAGVNIGGAQAPSDDRRAILRSRMLIEQFIERNKLLSTLRPIMGTRKTLWFAVKSFDDKVVEIHEDARTGLLTVSIEWTDAGVAARWANGFVALANEIIRQRDSSRAQANIGFVSRQIEKTNVVELRRVLFDIVESETKTLMLASSRQDYAFAVVDPAVPPELKARPARALIVSLGAFFGFALGVLVAVIRRMTQGARAAVP